jgi:hypothetical protein
MLDSDNLQSWRWKLQQDQPSSEPWPVDNNLISVLNCEFQYSSIHELFPSVTLLEKGDT